MNTYRNYGNYIVQLVAMPQAYTIDKEKIDKFFLLKNNPVKNSAVKSFVSFLEYEKEIEIDRFRYPRIRKHSKVVTPLTSEEKRILIEKMYPEWTLFAEVMFGGALRVSECSGIQVENFNWQEWVKDRKKYGSLKVTKTKRNKERIIPIKPELMEKILKYCPKEEGGLKRGYLFDFNHARYVRKKKKKYGLELAELKYINKNSEYFQKIIGWVSEKHLSRRVTSHILRHSRATELDEMGLSASSIRDYLGHENISTTSKYIHNTPEKLKKQLEKLGA